MWISVRKEFFFKSVGKRRRTISKSKTFRKSAQNKISSKVVNVQAGISTRVSIGLARPRFHSTRRGPWVIRIWTSLTARRTRVSWNPGSVNFIFRVGTPVYTVPRFSAQFWVFLSNSAPKKTSGDTFLRFKRSNNAIIVKIVVSEVYFRVLQTNDWTNRAM